mgnify:FL=1|jgi:hypothetical protein
MKAKWLLRVGVALLVHPSLWLTALVQVNRLAGKRWWLRPPFLPLPDPALMALRSVTQYGDAAQLPSKEDVVTWLRWTRSFSRVTT